MVLVLCKNKPLGDYVKCKDHLEREMLKEKGSSRRAQIPADDNESVFVSAEDHQKFCTLLSLTSAWVWYSTWKGFFPLPQIFFFFPSTFTFFFFFLVYKRKVDLFQIPHSPGIFAFCSMAQNTENLFLQMVWSSYPQNTGSNFEGLYGWNVPAVLVKPIEVVIELPTRGAALACCHF